MDKSCPAQRREERVRRKLPETIRGCQCEITAPIRVREMAEPICAITISTPGPELSSVGFIGAFDRRAA